MNSQIKKADNFIEVDGCKLTSGILTILKSFQEDDYLSRVQQNLSEVLLYTLLNDRGVQGAQPPSKEQIDDIASRLSLFIREIDELKLPKNLRDYADGE